MTREFLPEGKYKGKIKEWGFGQSKSGSQRFELTVALTHVERPEGAEAGEGEGVSEAVAEAPADGWDELEHPVRRQIHMYLTPKALPISTANIRAIGYTDDKLDRLHPDSEKPFDLFDTEVICRVYHDSYFVKEKQIDRHGDEVEVEVEKFSEKVELERGYTARLRLESVTGDGFKGIAEAFAAEQRKVAGKKADPDEAPAPRRRGKGR